VDGTPILDLKPYIPNYDIVSDAKYPEWISENLYNTSEDLPLLVNITGIERTNKENKLTSFFFVVNFH
jgi:tRNA (Thr-GGU) A37 N-methylase